MCGIVGYIGSKNATPVLVNALKKLEYRGYDSAGIAVYDGQDIVVRKIKGALKGLEEKLTRETVEGAMGIGHTRWATHGEPSETNAHPHLNEAGTIAVVHNGIIENYAPLKSWLQGQGIVFKSQTDTEVIAHLVNYHYNNTHDIVKAVLESLKQLEGSYALGVVCKDYPDRLVAARKEAPLIVGLGNGENFIASDIPAVLEYTREVIFLDQREVAVLYNDHIDLLDENGNHVRKDPYHVDWDLSSAEKGGYEHFMLKEIHEQPKALLDTLRPRLVFDGEKPVDIKFDEIDFETGDVWKNARRVVITACGTAYHAGMVGKYAFEKLARMPVAVDVASEFRYRNPILNKDDIFIVISQSGETADTLAALRLAKSSGAHVIAITNCVGSTVSREADDVVYTWAGPEIAVASTKAYTTQLACLYLLALKSAYLRGIMDAGEYRRLLAELYTIPEKVQQILDDKSDIQRFVSKNFNKEKVFYMGRQFDSASSLECALKLKEVSYMHSEAFAAGELKHGPIALIDTSTLCVALATEPALFDKLASNIVEVKTRGAATFVITQDTSGAFDQAADAVINIPETETAFESMLSIIPAQLFAYYCAIMRGNDPDKPRNLAKSVTVE
ncbi:MAG: glutamine--fructose-6-phosphate transaminase (isomerizing) [Treponemataceae bacterium]|nr:glutamine--fructose-6-phosphate transaminase (isomerizing) [Treponemataceae bacterium]